MSSPESDLCEDCGAPTTMVVSGRALCDRCADAAISAATGWPRLPEPPVPETLVGPDRVQRPFVYRLLRVPTGVEALAEETGRDAGEGYRFSLVGPHDVDVAALVEQLRDRVRREVARLYLERDDAGRDWQVADDELVGRVEEDPDDWTGPPRLVVDGRSLSWEQVGELVKPFTGWEFRLRFGEDVYVPTDIDQLGRRGAGDRRWRSRR